MNTEAQHFLWALVLLVGGAVLTFHGHIIVGVGYMVFGLIESLRGEWEIHPERYPSSITDHADKIWIAFYLVAGAIWLITFNIFK